MEMHIRRDSHVCIHTHTYTDTYFYPSIHKWFTESKFTEVSCCVGGIKGGPGRRDARSILSSHSSMGEWWSVLHTHVTPPSVKEDFFSNGKSKSVKKPVSSYGVAGMELSRGQLTRKVLNIWFSHWPRELQYLGSCSNWMITNIHTFEDVLRTVLKKEQKHKKQPKYRTIGLCLCKWQNS